MTVTAAIMPSLMSEPVVREWRGRRYHWCERHQLLFHLEHTECPKCAQAVRLRQFRNGDFSSRIRLPDRRWDGDKQERRARKMQAVMLRLDGLTNREIGEITGCSTQVASNRTRDIEAGLAVGRILHELRKMASA